MSEHVRIRTTPNKNVVLLMRKLSDFCSKVGSNDRYKHSKTADYKKIIAVR